MKYVLLVFALISVLPLSGWLRRNPRDVQKFAVLLGFLPFGITAIPHGNIAVISWAMWPGFVKGMEVSLLDILSLILYLALPKPRNPLPFRMLMGMYFIAVVISVFWSSVPFASVFYVWQLLRMYFVYTVIARACEDQRVVLAILTGLTLGLCLEAFVVLWQRFGLGLLQTPGTTAHQNGLGMVSYLVMLPLFALYLAGKKGWEGLIAPAAGGIIAMMTVSRATVGLAALGFAVTFLLSSLRSFNFRKATIAAVGLILILAASPFVLSSFEKRFALNPISDSYDERAAFEKTAMSIISDHPMGVGANNFVVVANTGGYFDRAGVAAVQGSRSAHVHNAYLLAAAETGYLGLLTLVLMLFFPMLAAFRIGWRYRKDYRGDLLLGLGTSFLLVYLQSFFEWAFFVYWFQYFLACALGLTAGLLHQLRSTQPAEIAARPMFSVSSQLK